MRTDIPEKLLKIADDIGEHGNVNLTRLVVLKKWFEKPERLSAFAIWVAARATSRKGKTTGAAAELFRESKALLAGADKCHPQLNLQKVQALHDRLRDFQNEYREQRWGAVRIVHNWNLMLVEHAGTCQEPASTLRALWTGQRGHRRANDSNMKNRASNG